VLMSHGMLNVTKTMNLTDLWVHFIVRGRT
jgi:hypothetical protein